MQAFTVNIIVQQSLLIAKKHSLPTTKEYILKEYADVFTGIGSLPGPAYHFELKEDYNPVRKPTMFSTSWNAGFI